MLEHLRNGGDTLVIWLMNILNSVVELEAVPSFLKMGNLVPVYKGRGKDPFLVNSYRGITVTSTIAKVLEFLILGRLEAVFSEAGIPHVNQTAYRKKVSCADAIFATQEVITRYVNSGNEVIMCLYDLQKAFDSVEFPVLLSRLHEAGVSGKTWRILKDWYEGGKCKVKVEGRLSEEFLWRGV